MLVFIGYRLMCSCAFSLLLPVVVDRLDCFGFRCGVARSSGAG